MKHTDYGGVQPALNNQEPTDAEFNDMLLNCIDCGQQFIWTAGEQAFFKDKNLQNPPKRCKPCKKAKNERIAAIEAAQSSGLKQRIEVTVTCASCRKLTTVPFYPSQGRPVYCRTCFLKLNPSLLEPEAFQPPT
ncbi:MAG TPA: zinc-ribbon domain containing protein [Pyrinomonadaceae bacterium]|jgi:CxxC-x17-CxxC domain-containing protein|nr:zinc-ribbon domain containing protein [Pyrinomonadaceae bacterium]